MKKLIPGVIFLMFFSVFSLPVFAAGNASLSFKTLTNSVRVNETFDVSVRANPSGEQVNTVRAVFTFDPTILQATWASLTGPLSRSAPGNYLDNSKGIVSWGGFSTKGPITVDGDFAKVTFKALKEGSTELKISQDSRLIADGMEKSNGSQAVTSVTVTAAATETNGGNFTLTSSSHEEETDWYKKTTAEFVWNEVKSDNPVQSYLYAFDETPNTDPTTKIASSGTPRNDRIQKNIADGTHYFHLKAVLKDETVTPAVHRKVQVDTKIPNQIDLSTPTDKLLEGESLWLTFATTDETSGVAQYQVSMDSSVFQTQVSPLEITDLKSGTYFFRVAALDRAGNTVYGLQSIRVYQKDTKLDRPAGFSPDEEMKKLQKSDVPEQKTDSKQSNRPNAFLLITLVLVLILGFGIIYAIKSKKLIKR